MPFSLSILNVSGFGGGGLVGESEVFCTSTHVMVRRRVWMLKESSLQSCRYMIKCFVSRTTKAKGTILLGRLPGVIGPILRFI